MTFSDIVYAMTGVFGWVVIALVAVALVFLLAGYLRQARAIVRTDGWSALGQHVRRHVLTRRPRHRR